MLREKSSIKTGQRELARNAIKLLGNLMLMD
jgi:hypothetical protein